MREAEEAERLRLPETASPPVFGRIRTEFQQARFLGMQFQTEPPKALGECCPKPFGIRLGLKSQHDVIGKAHDDHVALRALLTPDPDPQINHVMEIDVRQQWRHDAPYTKGNFQFERVISEWRGRPVLDLRRK